LIGVIENSTGHSFGYNRVVNWGEDHGFQVVKSVQVTSVQELLDLASKPTGRPTDEEGWVVFWPKAQLRVKIKRDDYMQLARILSRMSARAVFEAVRGGTFENMIKDLPLELANVPRLLEAEVSAAFATVHDNAVDAQDILYDQTKNNPEMSRKDKALLIQGDDRIRWCASYLFSKLDGQVNNKWLWSQVEDRLKKMSYFIRRLPTEEITP